jgi:hypothetical protein
VFDSIPHLISVAVMLLVPCLGILYVFRRERSRYRVRGRAPDAAVMGARCAGCDISLGAVGLLYVRDGTLVCAECRRCLEDAGERVLSDEELARLVSGRSQRSRRWSG